MMRPFYKKEIHKLYNLIVYHCISDKNTYGSEGLPMVFISNCVLVNYLICTRNYLLLCI